MIQCTNFKMIFENKLLLNIEEITFERAKLHIIKGDNGCGKTSFMRSIIGWIKPIIGYIQLNGSWTYQPQNFHLFNPKVKDNFKDLQRAIPYLKQFNLENYLDMHISKLSGGERQKIALIRTICEDTDVYFLDEPTSNMDESSKSIAYKLIQKELLDQSKTVVLIVHENVEKSFAKGIQHIITGQEIIVDKTW